MSMTLPDLKTTLPDYKKIASQLKRRRVSVAEKEVDQALSWLQKSRAKFTLKNQPAEKGNFVEIEYQWSSPPHSKDFECGGENGSGGLKSKDIKDGFILGQGHFIVGFEENLVGMKDGENKEFSLPWKNKKTVFKVKVRSVQRMELPELNNQFAQGLGRFDNLSGLKKSIKEGLNTEKEIAESQRLRQEILEKIKQQCELEPAIILKAISEKENIEVSDKEVNEAVNNILKHYPDIEKTRKLDLEQLKSYSREVITNEKTLAKLETYAKVQNS